MIRRLNPTDYYDGPYRPGTHCVLLALADELTAAAAPPVRRVADAMPTVTFWICNVTGPEDAEAVQAVRYPQYRFIRDGTERHCHVGLLDDDQLVDCFDKLED